MTDTIPPVATPAASQPGRAARPQRAKRKPEETATSASAADPVPTKAPTKLDMVTGLLARPEGASIEELCTATGWQAHSVRGAMAGALKRKGHVITSDKHEGVRRYRASTSS